MQKSEQINELAKALSNAQSEIEGAVKDAANSFFKSKYADLASVMDAIRKPFAKNGLSYVQSTRIEATGAVVLETILMHTSGQWTLGEYPVQGKDNTPQAIGSAMTYARRYSLSAMTGVAQIDDDAEAAMGRQDYSNKSIMKQDGKWAHGAKNPSLTPESERPQTYAERRG